MASTVGRIVVAFALGVLGRPAGWLPAVLGQETKNTTVITGDAPVPRATVVIDYLAWSRPSAIVIADATGHYSAVLDRPGTHEIHVLGLLTPAVKKDLVVGSNVLNVVASSAR